MKFSEIIRVKRISILREIVDASEPAPLLLLFYGILEDDYYYLSKYVGETLTHILNDRCEISLK